MKVWTNHVDWIVATDLEDVRKVLVEHYGDTDEITEWMNEGFIPVEDDKPITIHDYNGLGETKTLTAAEWVAKDGRCHLCSTEY